MKTATHISRLFNDNGTCFFSMGLELESLCGQIAETVVYGMDPVDRRYVFHDGSVITVTGSFWDLGYDGCWCWQGLGHEVGCPHA